MNAITLQPMFYPIPVSANTYKYFLLPEVFFSSFFSLWQQAFQKLHHVVLESRKKYVNCLPKQFVRSCSALCSNTPSCISGADQKYRESCASFHASTDLNESKDQNHATSWHLSRTFSGSKLVTYTNWTAQPRCSTQTLCTMSSRASKS